MSAFALVGLRVRASGRVTVRVTTAERVTPSVSSLQLFDDKLAGALRAGCVKLLCASALRSGGLRRFTRRQDLEDQERRDDVEIFLDPAYAERVLRKSARRVVFVSYAWRSRTDSDPDGEMLCALRAMLNEPLGRAVEGVFVDIACLHQHPRTWAQSSAFEIALSVMADGYASILGTMVARFDAMPPCPAELQTWLAITNVPDAIDEAELREALAALMLPQQLEVVSLECAESRGGRCWWRARWASASSAEIALEVLGAALPTKSLDARAVRWYYDLDYYARGWPTLENNAATEVLAQLALRPSVNQELASLPPKLVDIGRGAATVVSVPIDSATVNERWAKKRAAIEQATFTGKGDSEVVKRLYDSFIVKLGKAIQVVGNKLGAGVKSPGRPGMGLQKVLLMGKSGCGKTSMRSIIFAGYRARDTMRLGATLDVEHSHNRFLGDLVLNIWDCGGQQALIENYLESQRDHVFKKVQVLVYVFDMESRDLATDLEYYTRCLRAVQGKSPSAKVFCLVHKMDLIPEEQRQEAFAQRKHELTVIGRSVGVDVTCCATSIWDETLHRAWSQIVRSLLPTRIEVHLTPEVHLTRLCEACRADEIVLFERATCLAIVQAAARPLHHQYRLVEMGGMLKRLKLLGSRRSQTLTSMQVEERGFSMLAMAFTSTTFAVVVTTDPAAVAAVTLANVELARPHFESLLAGFSHAA